MLEEKYFFAFALFHAGRRKGIGFVTGRNDQIVIPNREFAALEQVFAMHLFLLGIQAHGFGLVVFETRNGADLRRQNM